MDRSEQSFVWHADLEIGVNMIDKEHRQLFKIMNKIHDMLEDPKKHKFACVEGIKFMRSHALQHFAHEEEYMRSIHYEGYEMHRELHRAFTFETLPTVEHHLEKTDYSPEAVERFLGVCIGWLTAHTLFEDRAIIGKVNSYWNDPNPDVNHFLCKSLQRVMSELANIQADPLSLHYAGEKNLQTINYQVIYDDNSDRPWKVTVSLERGLALKLLSIPFGSTVETLDTVTMNALKELIQMMVHRMGVFHHEDKHFKILQDKFLSDAELKSLFKYDVPQYSILFGTDHGLMVFSVDAVKQESRTA